jgi:hypothetical protein
MRKGDAILYRCKFAAVNTMPAKRKRYYRTNQTDLKHPTTPVAPEYLPVRFYI